MTFKYLVSHLASVSEQTAVVQIAATDLAAIGHEMELIK